MVSGERNEDASNVGSALSLARILRTLKRHGSSLLVVGLSSEEGQYQVCGRMLGDDAAGPRRRLLVVTGADPASVAERARHAQRPPADTARYITYAADARSASNGRPSKPASETTAGNEADDGDGNGENEDYEARSGPGGADDTLPGRRHVDGDRLADLGDAIEAEIDAIEAEADTLVPAELRVCLDSLTPLLDAYDREAVVRFLDRITTRVKRANGMGHVHLPVPRDWEAVSDLEAPFDAVVELRVEQGRTQQRWHLRNADVTSDWFPV